MGYHKIITYILESEDGTSLKASGWHCEVEKCGGEVGMFQADREKLLSPHYLGKSRNILLARNKDGQRSCEVIIP